MIEIKHQAGVTLLELLTVLAIFSLIMIMGYQGIVQLAYNQRYIDDAAQGQTQQAIAHRSLRQALESRAALLGNSSQFSLNLQSSDSAYFTNRQSQTFVISGNTLSTYFDSGSDSTVLLQDIEDASFTYITHNASDISHRGSANLNIDQNSGQTRDQTTPQTTRASLWRGNSPPELVELSWQSKGELKHWVFSAR